PDPFYRDNEGKIQWAGLSDWQYQRAPTKAAATPCLHVSQHPCVAGAWSLLHPLSSRLPSKRNTPGGSALARDEAFPVMPHRAPARSYQSCCYTVYPMCRSIRPLKVRWSLMWTRSICIEAGVEAPDCKRTRAW
ncbi:hypothetical protein ABQF89_20005, partial [Xanthomonas campestris pv. raphani]|uniref:hypothetical protein n=1 Tax=Xanthomonas campestris TaxID=339 RepID=UPI0032E4BF70